MSNYYSSMINREKRKAKRNRVIRTLVLLFFIGIAVLAYAAYSMLYKANVWLNNKESVSLDIRSGSDWDDVKGFMYTNGLIVQRNTFEWVAKLMKYPDHVKPGHYVITSGMNNRELISKLRSGRQDPVKLVFNNIRTKEDLAGHIASQIEADSASLIKLLSDSAYVSGFGFRPSNILTMFIPNTYAVYWNITPAKFMERMHKEYNNFWNASRVQKLDNIKLSRLEVMTLASIVEKESNKNDEKPDIAGVYMNRLKQNWLLQADPTLVFALGDFTIKRVLNVYKKIDSPYNTYMYIGLPPGPICMPSVASIDAVLNYRQHNYMYFCAREDFSGYHNFAVNQQEHELNARRYQEALNKQGIMK
ncbi:MAG: endolytic transglycosylase MltG [Bacteroidales bacterium]|nr:endolytic transglycosylase MltG [Bacteroidales bacterium]